MGVVFGEVQAIKKRQPGLLWEDDFNNGPQGWVQLLNGRVPAGVVYLDHEITYNGSGHSLLIGTEDQSSAGTRVWGYGVAIKRMSRPAVVGKLYVEWWWAWGSLHGQDTPRNIDFGVDQCAPDGTRRFFKVRWLNYDEGSSTRVSKYQLETAGASTFVDVPSGAINHGYNENKRNLYHLEAVFDVGAGCYDGLRVNGQGFGSLASPADTSLRSNTLASTTLASFSGGLNCAVEVYNRLNTNSSKAWVNVAYSRGIIL